MNRKQKLEKEKLVRILLDNTLTLLLLTLSQTANFRLFQTEKKFADDNFKFEENDINFSKRVENTVGKGEIARKEQFLHFQQCFRKICSANT